MFVQGERVRSTAFEAPGDAYFISQSGRTAVILVPGRIGGVRTEQHNWTYDRWSYPVPPGLSNLFFVSTDYLASVQRNSAPNGHGWRRFRHVQFTNRGASSEPAIGPSQESLDVHRAGKCTWCRSKIYCIGRELIARNRRITRQGASIALTHCEHVKSGISVPLTADGAAARLNAAKRLMGAVRGARSMRRLPTTCPDVSNALHDGTVLVASPQHRSTGARVNVRQTIASGDKRWKLPLTEFDFGPVGPAPHVGIEIECGIPMSAARIRQAMVDHDLATKLALGTDGSVNVDGSSWELRLCARQSDINSVLERLGRFLAAVNAKVNHTCGLHVHLDMRHRDWQTCYRRLYRAQRWLYSLVTSYRGSSQYCREVGERPTMSDRYRSINAAAVTAHKTLEVRLHHGCVDVKRIAMWVKLLVSIIDGPTRRRTDDINQFVRRFPDDVKSFVRKYSNASDQDKIDPATWNTAESDEEPSWYDDDPPEPNETGYVHSEDY